jgi:hypothetical protein
MADQEVVREFATLRAEIQVLRTVLIQLLGSSAIQTPDPQRTVAHMHEALAQRLDKLPISMGSQQGDAIAAMAREKLADFFRILGQSIPPKARG